MKYLLLPLLLACTSVFGQITSFTLQDVNTSLISGVAASNRAGQMVKPEDYRNRISLYYFGKEA